MMVILKNPWCDGTMIHVNWNMLFSSSCWSVWCYIVCKHHINKRPSACSSDVHQRSAPVGQRGSIIPGSALWFLPYLPYPLNPSLYMPLPSMLLFSSSSPQAGGVWTMQCDLAARGGIQVGALGPQMRPKLNLPPSILPLPPPPLGAKFPKPPPLHAQQANQVISVCYAT